MRREWLLLIGILCLLSAGGWWAVDASNRAYRLHLADLREGVTGQSCLVSVDCPPGSAEAIRAEKGPVIPLSLLALVGAGALIAGIAVGAEPSGRAATPEQSR